MRSRAVMTRTTLKGGGYLPLAMLKSKEVMPTMLPQNPNEKMDAVKEAYLSHIIPNIMVVYEKTNLLQEPFILTHCAILGLSGFYTGEKNTGGSTYKAFVAGFFPSQYNPDGLWKDLRNSMIHAYTLPSHSYILAHKHPEKHLRLEKDVKSSRTGQRYDLIYLNFEDFFSDFSQAAQSYFEKVEAAQDLIKKLCSRYDIAPPASYIPDRDVKPGSRLAL